MSQRIKINKDLKVMLDAGGRMTPIRIRPENVAGVKAVVGQIKRDGPVDLDGRRWQVEDGTLVVRNLEEQRAFREFVDRMQFSTPDAEWRRLRHQVEDSVPRGPGYYKRLREAKKAHQAELERLARGDAKEAS